MKPPLCWLNSFRAACNPSIAKTPGAPKPGSGVRHTLRHVTYRNLGCDSAADLYLPPDFDQGKIYPAIVSTHPINSCNEQTSGSVCGRQLAQAGFVVLAFDASFQAASCGAPRFVEDPAIRVYRQHCHHRPPDQGAHVDHGY